MLPKRMQSIDPPLGVAQIMDLRRKPREWEAKLQKRCDALGLFFFRRWRGLRMPGVSLEEFRKRTNTKIKMSALPP